MALNDLFKKSASVEAYWKFYMLLFENYGNLHLTRSKIAKQMKKSNALVTSIVTKLSPMNLVLMSYNPDISGTSKYSIYFQFEDIITLLATELGYNEQQLEELYIAFDEWFKAKELQFNFVNVEQSSFYTFFSDPLISEIAKNVPLLFFSVLYATMVYSVFQLDPETQTLKLEASSPYPRKVLIFSARLFVKTITEIGKYLNKRFLTSHAKAYVRRYLTSDNTIVSILNSVQEQLLKIEEGEMQEVISIIFNFAEQRSYWFADEEWFSLSALLDKEIIENLEKNSPIVIELPLKDGKTHKFTVSGLSRQSSIIKEHVTDYHIISNDTNE